MLSYVCFMPCNREFGEEMGEDFGTSNYTYLYCGAYILTDWEPGAYRVLKRNPTYWDIDNIHIEELNETFNSEASTLSAELFKRGEIMPASLTASEAQTWLADPELSKMIRPGRAAFNYSYWYAFNYYIKAATPILRNMIRRTISSRRRTRTSASPFSMRWIASPR